MEQYNNATETQVREENKVLRIAGEPNDIKQLKALVAMLIKKVDDIEQRLTRTMSEAKSARDAARHVTRK
jgi:hypothetical protein